MKKSITILTSFLLAFIIFTIDSPTADAAHSSNKLTSGQKSETTKRVNVKSKLGFSINNTGKKTVHFNIFRNGKLHANGGDLKPGKILSDTNGTWAPGAYSLRVYCGPRFKPQVGCNATFSIGN